jgi:hypothetical protein
MVNLEACRSILDKFQQPSNFEVHKKILEEFLAEIHFEDPSDELIDNESFQKLSEYVEDSQELMSLVDEDIDTIAKFLRDSSTDMFTFLDNFVYDDTERDTVEEYIEEDFNSTSDFLVHLLKGYFYTNFIYYLEKI